MFIMKPQMLKVTSKRPNKTRCSDFLKNPTEKTNMEAQNQSAAHLCNNPSIHYRAYKIKKLYRHCEQTEQMSPGSEDV